MKVPDISDNELSNAPIEPPDETKIQLYPEYKAASVETIEDEKGLQLEIASEIETIVDMPPKDAFEIPIPEVEQEGSPSSSDTSNHSKVNAVLREHSEMPHSRHALTEAYYTQPTFTPPNIIIEHKTQDRSKLAPGYYFIASLGGVTWAPQIFNQDGQLVYWGAQQTELGRITNFSPCPVKNNSNDLCWTESSVDDWSHEVSRHRKFDKTYTQLGRDIAALPGLQYPSSLEANFLSGGKSFIQIVPDMRKMNLSRYSGPVDGWMRDGCFHELRLSDRKSMFSWCALDHLFLDETMFYLDLPGQKNHTAKSAGFGTFTRPWDFAHLNSVDKTPEGDYIVSARHLNSVFKVAGAQAKFPKTVLWRLNGKQNDFTFYHKFTFSLAQHVRYLGSVDNKTIISLYNNGLMFDENDTSPRQSSSGMIIKLDEREMLATLVHEYKHPDECFDCHISKDSTDGSFDYQAETAGAVVSWSSSPHVSEFSAQGELLFHASIGNHTSRTYKVSKRPWIGLPAWPPSILAYQQTCKTSYPEAQIPDSSLLVYASWNGATEVKSWRVKLSTHSNRGPWILAGTYTKNDFETKIEPSGFLTSPQSRRFYPYVYVEALDVQGNVLGNITAKTFVPKPNLLCEASGCAVAGFNYGEEFSYTDTCFLEKTSIEWSTLIFMISICILAMVICLRYWSRRDWREPNTDAAEQSREKIVGV